MGRRAGPLRPDKFASEPPTTRRHDIRRQHVRRVEAVPSAAITLPMRTLPVDVRASNYTTYSTAGGTSPIIFDHDGTITDDPRLGARNAARIREPLVRDGAATITEAVAC